MIIFLHSLSYVALESKKLQDPKHVTFTQISLPISILYSIFTRLLQVSSSSNDIKKSMQN